MPNGPTRRRVLVVTQYYLPATGGGTIVDALGAVRSAAEVADVRVLAGDRDLDGGVPLAVPLGGWHDHPGGVPAEVRYVTFGRRSLREVAEAVRDARPDTVLLFSTWAPGSLAVLVLHRLGRLAGRPVVVVAPAGELFEGALRQKATKKRVVLRVARWLGLWKGVRWRASDQQEAATIRAAFPRAAVEVAPVLPAAPHAVREHPGPRPAGPVRLVSVGTVGVKKGLDRLLEHVAAAGRAGVPVHLDVFGAEIDPTFSARCRDRIAALPDGSDAVLHGLRGHDVIAAALAQADAFALATQGENYGVAVLEALDAGCPVLISDTTPWRALRGDGCGWDLPLDDTAAWVAALVELRDADAATRSHWRDAALRRAARARGEAEADGADAWRRLLGLADR